VTLREKCWEEGDSQSRRSGVAHASAERAGCRAAARFRRYGRHVGAVAAVLVKDHTVIVPDLRGMGLFGTSGYGLHQEKPGCGHCRRHGALKVQKADLVTHDIGNMVGYALAAQYPARITRWAVIDAPVTRHRRLGQTSFAAAVVALQFPRPRYGAPGAGSRADLSGSLLQRTVG